MRPLELQGRRALVDGHPICEGCGAPAVPTGPDRWRHLAPGRPYPRRSRWLAPVTLAELRRLPSYEAFAARYPEAVRPPAGPAAATTEEHWREGVRRLEAYAAGLARLGLTGNPYLELVEILAGGPPGVGDWRLPPGLARVLDLPNRRRELAARLAWAIPNEMALAAIAGYAPVLDGGAGTGYWAALLRQRGVDVVATDVAPPAAGGNKYHKTRGRGWTEVRPMTTVAAIRAYPDRTLLLCWPPPDDDAAGYHALRAYRGEILLYVGGGPGGPTGTVRLHRELALNWTPIEEVGLPGWPGVPDRLTVWRRNRVRRAHQVRDRCAECARFLPTGSSGRCGRCVAANPPALALRLHGHLVEYPQRALDEMHPALRAALRASPNRLRC